MVQEISFKDISYSSGGNFVQCSKTISAILIEDIMRNISVKYFRFGKVVREERAFKILLINSFGWPIVWLGRFICVVLAGQLHYWDLPVKLFEIWMWSC